jgi:RNase adapter protein RapZ
MSNTQTVEIVSFGYKHGPPPYADLLFNVRFIANPYHVAQLRDKEGSDPGVRDHVLTQPCTQRFLSTLRACLPAVLEEYLNSAGPNYQRIVIAFGCAGGRQRSVCLALECACLVEDILSARGTQPRPSVVVCHRDIARKED